jgi:hypothetical protein
MNYLILNLRSKAVVSFKKDGYTSWVVDEQKFAELIVEECCNQLIKQGNSWLEFSHNPPEGQESLSESARFTAYRLKEDAVILLYEHFDIE